MDGHVAWLLAMTKKVHSHPRLFFSDENHPHLGVEIGKAQPVPSYRRGHDLDSWIFDDRSVKALAIIRHLPALSVGQFENRPALPAAEFTGDCAFHHGLAGFRVLGFGRWLKY